MKKIKWDNLKFMILIIICVDFSLIQKEKLSISTDPKNHPKIWRKEFK
jgi:hypothetical protein